MKFSTINFDTRDYAKQQWIAIGLYKASSLVMSVVVMFVMVLNLRSCVKTAMCWLIMDVCDLTFIHSLNRYVVCSSCSMYSVCLSSPKFSGGGNKWEILAQFSTSITFDAVWFRNRATDLKSKTSIWSGNDWPSFQLRQFTQSSPDVYQGVKIIQNLVSYFWYLRRCNFEKKQQV